MHRLGVEHALVRGVVLAFVALVVGSCGGPGEPEPRPLPEDQQALRPGEYRSEEFEPSLSFRVGEGWTTSPPELYDALRITRGHETGGWASRTSGGRGSTSPPGRAHRTWWTPQRTWSAGSGGIRT